MADGIGPTPAPIAAAPGAPPGGAVAPNPAAAANFQRMQTSRRGAGSQAAAMLQISQAIQQIQNALPNLPIGSEVHKATLKAVSDLSKHFQGPSDATDGAQQTMAQDNLRQMMQQAMMRRVMQQQGGGQGGGPPDMPSSTPLPGA